MVDLFRRAFAGAYFKVNESILLAFEAASGNAELARLHRGRCGAEVVRALYSLHQAGSLGHNPSPRRGVHRALQGETVPVRNLLAAHALRSWVEVQNKVYRSETPAV